MTKSTYEELERSIKELEKAKAERMRMEKTIRLQSEVLENMAEGVYLIRTSDGVIVYANPTFEKMFGYDSGELINKHVSIVNAPCEKSSEEIAREIIQDLKKKGTWSGEIRNIRKDGTPFWCHANVSTFVHHDYGEVWVSVHEDVTDRKMAEDELKKYRVLFENLQDLFYRADTDGNIILISPSCEKIFGYASEEAIGMNLADDFYVYPEKRKEFLTVLKDKGYVEDFEAEIKKKDGSTIWVSTNAHYYTDKEGNVLGVEGTTRDVTKRKKVEEALRVSEQRFRELVDLLPQTVCEIDLAGNFTFKNLHGFESYGYTQKDIDKGLNALQLFIPEERDKINENIQRILSGEKLGGNEYTALRKDGSRFPVIMFCSPIIYKNKPVGLRGIIVDITERKRSEKSLNEYRKQIQQSERLAATGRLAASIAHEINNPLQAISANFGFLVQALPDNFKENNSIEQVKISVNRIKNTVKQLLDIHHSKIETEQKVNVNEVIESTLNLLKNQLMIDKIKVNRKLSTNIPLTRGIAQELLQVFMNLILNAQGAMKGGGVLNISTNVKDSKLQIVFRDNGCGISEGDIDYIFDPFYTTKSKMLGTGLGLSISKGIVQSFGGEINVKSQIGKGTTFLITFPIS